MLQPQSTDENKYATGSTEIKETSLDIQNNYQSPVYSENPNSGFSSDVVTFLDATFTSFDGIQSDQKHTEWIKDADSKSDFFSLIKNEENMERYKNWLWKANAETELELLKKANCIKGGDSDRADAQARGYTNNGTMGTWVKPGWILFCTNRNNQLVYGQGAHNFATSLTSKDPVGPIDLNSPKNFYIKKKNITIVTLQSDEIAIALFDRKPIILLPGRHCYNDPNFILKKKDIFTVTSQGDIFGVIEKKNKLVNRLSVTLVMILPGFLGFGYEKAKPVILKAGLHISREPSFQFLSKLNMRTLSIAEGPKINSQYPGSHISHDNIHIIRIDQNQYGLARMDGEPVFLKSGLHVYNNPSFDFKGVKYKFEEHIEHENLHIIQVKPNKIGCAWEGNNPVFINPGIWYKNNALFKFDRFAYTADEKIEHGPMTRYQVRHGQIGFAWKDGEVVELSAGIQIVRDPNFKFAKCFNVNERVIHFGNIAHITTPEGYVRPVYVDGQLQILTSGYKKFYTPNLVINQCFPIGEIIASMEQIEVLTRDRTPMLVTGQVTYQVSNPKQLILTLKNVLSTALEKTVDAILRHAFSITDLSTISPDPHQTMTGENTGMGFFRDGDDSGGEGRTFQGELCQKVHKELDQCTASWGITIRDVAISSIHFKDRAVAEKLANATSNTRTAEAEFDLTQAKNKIRLEVAQSDASLKLIDSENHAKLKKIDVEVESELKIIAEQSKVKAQAMKRDQEIKTKAFEVESKANAEALKIRAIAEAKRDSDLLEAEGLKALAEAQIAKCSNPSLLQLEMMRHWVEGMGYLSQVPQPAVLLRDNGEEGDDQGSQLLNVFRHQGRSLLSAAMKKDDFQDQNRGALINKF